LETHVINETLDTNSDVDDIMKNLMLQTLLNCDLTVYDLWYMMYDV